jgi:hypothetical protein
VRVDGSMPRRAATRRTFGWLRGYRAAAIHALTLGLSLSWLARMAAVRSAITPSPDATVRDDCPMTRSAVVICIDFTSSQDKSRLTLGASSDADGSLRRALHSETLLIRPLTEARRAYGEALQSHVEALQSQIDFLRGELGRLEERGRFSWYRRRSVMKDNRCFDAEVASARLPPGRVTGLVHEAPLPRHQACSSSSARAMDVRAFHALTFRRHQCMPSPPPSRRCASESRQESRVVRPRLSSPSLGGATSAASLRTRASRSRQYMSNTKQPQNESV